MYTLTRVTLVCPLPKTLTQDFLLNVLGYIGDVPRTELGCNQQPLVSPLMAKVIKGALAVVMRHSAADATKTQVWLSASRDVREKDIKGQYWEPMWSWKQTYVRSKKGPVNTLAGDEGEWKKLWQFCEEAVAKAGGDNIEA